MVAAKDVLEAALREARLEVAQTKYEAKIEAARPYTRPSSRRPRPNTRRNLPSSTTTPNYQVVAAKGILEAALREAKLEVAQTKYEAKLAELNNDPNHPQVVAAKDVLEDAKKQRDKFTTPGSSRLPVFN